MKKKIVIGLLLLIPFISILLVVMFRGVVMPTNEEIVKELQGIEYYKADVTYIVENIRGEEVIETKQQYDKETGMRVEFGEELIKTYIDDEIQVQDNLTDTEYVIDSKMDILNPLAFLNNILSKAVKTDSLKEAQEEWGEIIYIQLDVELFLDNSHLDSARIFIDKEQRIPIGTIVYNSQGDVTLRIIYDNFEKS